MRHLRLARREAGVDMIEATRITPDYRNSGKLQFVVGYTASGAQMCVHLTTLEVCERLEERYGKGILVDDGTDLAWRQELAGD